MIRDCTISKLNKFTLSGRASCRAMGGIVDFKRCNVG